MTRYRLLAAGVLMCCSGLALAQGVKGATRPRTADASDGSLFFESVLQGHLVETCKRLSPEQAPQLEAARQQWLNDRAKRLSNGRSYSLKVFEESGSSEQKESNEIKEGVRTHFEPQIAADPKGKCAGVLAGLSSMPWSKDPLLPVPTRGGTQADHALSADIYRQAQGAALCQDTQSVELLVLERTPTLIRERWIMHGCGKAVPLHVELTPGPTNGTTRFTVGLDRSGS